MKLSEKIVSCRKRLGWSQEDLAERLAVSRQSVSKWESNASQPELDKIIQLADLFGVTTDALLLEELDPLAAPAAAEPAAVPETAPVRTLSRQDASDYLDLYRRLARRFALAVALCVFSPTPLILLSGLVEFGSLSMGEGQAAGLGVVLLLLLVAPAVAVFIAGGIALSRYSYISEEPFLPEPGLTAWARAEQDAFRPRFARSMIIGVVLCILGVIPLLLAGTMGLGDLAVVLSVDILLWLVMIAVYLFVCNGMIYGCFTQLLQEEDYAPEWKRGPAKYLDAVYWCTVTAIYLAVSFLTMRWDMTWIIWACAGVLFGGICQLVRWHQKSK